MAHELWDLYDARGQKTGRTMIRGQEVPAGLYHLAVHIWPINDKGEYLIQRRAPTVQWSPNLWAATGGSAVSGEDALSAGLRELREELGYRAAAQEMALLAHLRRSSSFCSVFTISLNCDASAFVLQKEEVSAVRWCSQAQIMRMVADNAFYNYGDSYFRMLFAGSGSRR
ncbi:MAG: NUDIX domain-containing protein [Clostridia bacterium]|nr:NUDIX domain-containing protein [Clostridia bacterium]